MSTVEVEILYSDFSRSPRVLLTNRAIDGLRKDGVLYIAMSTEWGNRKALVARMWSRQNNDKYAGPDPWWGADNYAIGILPNGTFFTYQWDDDQADYFMRSVADGSSVSRHQRPLWFPSEAMVHRFTGAYVSPDEWKRAMQVFETEMF